jgi:hypothetical protein
MFSWVELLLARTLTSVLANIIGHHDSYGFSVWHGLGDVGR